MGKDAESVLASAAGDSDLGGETSCGDKLSGKGGLGSFSRCAALRCMHAIPTPMWDCFNGQDTPAMHCQQHPVKEGSINNSVGLQSACQQWTHEGTHMVKMPMLESGNNFGQLHNLPGADPSGGPQHAQHRVTACSAGSDVLLGRHQLSSP